MVLGFLVHCPKKKKNTHQIPKSTQIKQTSSSNEQDSKTFNTKSVWIEKNKFSNHTNGLPLQHATNTNTPSIVSDDCQNISSLNSTAVFDDDPNRSDWSRCNYSDTTGIPITQLKFSFKFPIQWPGRRCIGLSQPTCINGSNNNGHNRHYRTTRSTSL